MSSIWSLSTSKEDVSSQSHTIENVDISYSSYCPHVSCKGLKIFYDETILNEQCIGTFQNRISSNLFQKFTSNIYLYFNCNLFRWVCDYQNEHENNKCSDFNSLHGYSLQKSWFNAHLLNHDGDSITIPWSNGYNATIQCIDTPPPTTEPTKYPIKTPTKYPYKSITALPTRLPTPSPTAEPTRNPTKSPTLSPTQSPTTPPTFSPTLRNDIARLYPNYVFIFIVWMIYF